MDILLYAVGWYLFGFVTVFAYALFDIKRMQRTNPKIGFYGWDFMVCLLFALAGPFNVIIWIVEMFQQIKNRIKPFLETRFF